MYPHLSADVIVMPHHGSKNNLLENYAEKLGAKIAIVSCQKKRLQSSWKPDGRIDAYYTPINGAITVRIKKNGAIKITTQK